MFFQHANPYILGANESITRSNGSLLNLDCSSLVGWTDADTGPGESTQVAFDGNSCFRFDTNTSAVGNDKAARTKNVGSIEALGDRYVASLSIYFDAIGTKVDNDYFLFQVRRSDVFLFVAFASDDLYISGGTYVSVGSGLVVQDVWQEWTFDVDLSSGAALAKCDVYLNLVLVASNVDCSYTGSYTDGDVLFYQYGYTTNNRITYLDWVKIGTGFIGD